MKNILLLFLILCVFDSLFAQKVSLYTLPLDSLINLIKDSVYGVNATNRHQETLQLAQFVLKRTYQEGNMEQIASVHDLIALWHYYSVKSNNPDSVLFHDRKALEYLNQSNNAQRLANAHDRVGKDLVVLGRFMEAEKEFFEVIKIYESLDEPMELGSAYASLNYLYRESQDYEQALIYGEKSLKLIEANKEEESDLIEPLLGLIFTYPEVDKANLALEKAQQVVDIIGEMYGTGRTVHMANVRSWRGETYVALGEYDKAWEDFYYAWDVIKEIVDHEEEADGWKGDIGNVLRLQGNHEDAIPYLRDFIEHLIARNVKDTEELEDAQFWLAECYATINQSDSAYYFLSQAQASQKKRLTGNIAALNSELRIKYDSEQKDATIRTQQDRIREQQLIQYLILGIIGILLAFLITVYLLYRRIRDKSQQLEKLNVEMAISNQELDQRNHQNELLLKEIHHRVKNNLEMISGLLELQSLKSQDPKIRRAILDSQNRVLSIGLIHQKLYQGEQLGEVDMQEYLSSLCNSILDNLEGTGRITVSYHITPGLVLDIDTAVPIGLMANELVVNAIKHAFPDQQRGNIQVSLREISEEELFFEVSDDGVGKPSDTSLATGSFGTQLIQLLTRQLDGDYQEHVDNGTRQSFYLKKQQRIHV